MRATRILLVLLLLVHGADVLAEARVRFSKGGRRPSSPSLIFDTGAAEYVVALPLKDKAPVDPSALQLRGLGLFPAKRGWSGLGNWVHVQARETTFFPVSVVRIAEMENGERARAVLEGAGSAGAIRLIFAADAGGDALYLSVEIRPQVSIPEWTVRLQAYPGEFGSTIRKRDFPHGPPEPRTLTAFKERKGKGKFLLAPAREPWILLYDRHYDPGKNKTHGGAMTACGLLYNPDDVTKVVVGRGAASAAVKLVLPGGGGGDVLRTDMVFWEFAKSNQQGIRTMKSLIPLHQGEAKKRPSAVPVSDNAESDTPIATEDRLPDEKKDAPPVQAEK